IVEFATALQNEFDYEILSTGGTEKMLREAGLTVKAVEDYTGFPEMLDGRVKTLHPMIHGGLLGLRENEKHMEQLVQYQIGLIDMVVVNLYPFQQTVASGAPFEDIIEMIDIGGPSMLRSAAKNHQSVAILSSISWYEPILAELRGSGGKISPETRKEMAAEVFWQTAQYDAAITKYLSEGNRQLFPVEKIEDLRYGENPHQKATAWRDPNAEQAGTISGSTQLHGKEMSFLNYYDTDAALAMVREYDDPAAVFVKHANPCGIAQHESLLEAFKRGFACDPRSAFGVIIAFNRPVTPEIANEIEAQRMFVEVIIAPSFEQTALKQLQQKKNLRLLEIGEIAKLTEADFDIKKISGGYLTQDIDTQLITEADLQFVTEKKPSSSQIQDLLFAWKVVKHVKSNAIVLAKDEATVGIGAGQMSRVDSTEIAVRKAGERAKGSVLASDAFFPFPDSIEEAAKHGIAAIIQPGGSIKDDEVIVKANELGIPMVFTGKRAFKHGANPSPCQTTQQIA
ncbi:MAG: bifunctional phosphoribosylaminoimidazolecarboxamide formyltransferase/IMP cyclohydrolase, partial [Candidatus Gracilibacteria bacterium]|nr:bifunctional phosphoribosylaminoimidazolecarboxamide formyltransferase/IMP cyclohydrolase [Candidatus Gracilibacteria bacterium]